MTYNPQKHHRRSIRLKGYDYSQPGAYFVTICTQNRKCLFGEIVNGEMVLNEAGRMVKKWYFELENKFPDILCDEYVIMPNHFHAIIINVGNVERVAADHVAADHVAADLRVCPNETGTRGRGERVAADLRVCPNETDERVAADLRVCPNETGERVAADLRVCPNETGERDRGERVAAGTRGRGEHTGSPLPRVVQWFKTMTTNEYIRGVKQNGWQPFPGKLWQRNYYEHIVRNEQELHRIRAYIANNPVKWALDHNHPSTTGNRHA